MVEHLRTITLKCPSCGGSLSISDDLNQFACGYCGTEQIVERRGGTVALKPITDAIARVQVGTDKTAAELALKRLQEELNNIERKRVGLHIQAQSKVQPGQKIIGATSIPVLLLWLVLSFGVGEFGIGIVILLVYVVVAVIVWVHARENTELWLTEQLQTLERGKRSIEEKIAKNKAIVD